MDSLAQSLPWGREINQSNDYDHNPSRTASYPNHHGPTANQQQTPAHHQNGQTMVQVCADVKPRLTKEQHDILERHFQQQQKPTTSTKKGFADALGVPLDKINNWFQNRRAKVKQDMKKQMNAFAMYQATLAQHSQQYLPPPQPLPSSGAQEFFGPNPNTALPTTEYATDSASSDSGNSHANFSNQVDYNASVPTIIEASQPGLRDDMAPHLQSAGYAVPEAHFSSGPGLENGLAFGAPHFVQDFQSHSYTLAPDLSGFDVSSFNDMGLSDSLAYPPYLQTSAPSVQPMPSLSDSSTITPLSSSASPHTMPSLTLSYSHPNWTDDRKDSVATPDENHRGPNDAPSTLHHHDGAMTWPSAQLMDNGIPEHDFYQHHHPSAPSLTTQEPSDLDKHKFGPPELPSEAFDRRSSSTTHLVESMNTVDISCPPGSESGIPAPQASGLAARRQKARPANLGLAALRSASYSAGMPVSPGSQQCLTAPPDQSLRRIRSGGAVNGGRISKPLPNSGQRSPLNFSFAEAAASPKFARHASNSYTVSSPGVTSPAVSVAASSLAPPTPLTPGNLSVFPPWQTHGVTKTYQRNNNSGVSVSWSGEPLNNAFHVSVSSPPDTPLDAEQMAQYRSHLQARAQAMYRDTPPQSAPATQQSFHPTALMPQSHSMHSHGNNSDKSGHFRRPSLPEQSYGIESQMQWPAVPLFSETGNLQMSNPMHFNQQSHQEYPGMQQEQRHMQQYNNTSSTIQESLVKPDFSVHQYSPPQLSSSASPPRSDSVPKLYHFSNHGPQDFEAPTSKS